MSTHNMFLWRNNKIYSRIITKYSSLISPLLLRTYMYFEVLSLFQINEKNNIHHFNSFNFFFLKDVSAKISNCTGKLMYKVT